MDSGLAAGNIVGGTTEGADNKIAFNGRRGVSLLSGTGTGNAILTNSISTNTGLGIDLSPSGVTPNDSGDGDTGANNLQNFPVLTSATTGSGTITVGGTLDSSPSTAFRVELFANAACDPSGNGEGETFLGFKDVTTDDGGNVSFTAAFSAAVTVGQLITATATDPSNNTSEFSSCQSVTAATPVPGLSTPGLAALAALLWAYRRRAVRSARFPA